MQPEAFVRELLCDECGRPASRVELRGPNDDGTWRMLFSSIEAGNGSGDDIPAARAALLTEAFAEPITYRAVHRAGFYDDAGMCSSCGVAYCSVHWNVSRSGFGTCPAGHGHSLDPHWSPE